MTEYTLQYNWSDHQDTEQVDNETGNKLVTEAWEKLWFH